MLNSYISRIFLFNDHHKVTKVITSSQTHTFRHRNFDGKIVRGVAVHWQTGNSVTVFIFDIEVSEEVSLFIRKCTETHSYSGRFRKAHIFQFDSVIMKPVLYIQK